MIFGKSPEEANETRLDCSRGERCTLCGKPAARKLEEDTFGEHRHPLTAYVCEEHFERIVCPYKFKDEPGHWQNADTEPPPSEKTNPVASPAPVALDEDEEDHLG